MPALPRYLICCAIPLLLAGGGCARPLAVSGQLAGDHIWRGTVHIRGDVVIPEGARLHIEPGTTVLFLPATADEDRLTEHPYFPGSELIVRGAIVADGEPAAPIVFRHLDAAAPAGGWGGINLQQSPQAVFRHCLFTQADSAVHSQESTVIVERSIFRGNVVGIRFHSSRIRIEKNLLVGNATAIRFHFGAPSIVDNCFRGNAKGIFMTSYPADFRIERNDFVGNTDFNVVLGEEVPNDLPLPMNWWGSDDRAVIEQGFFDGRRESHLGRILYAPAADGPVAGIACTP